MMQLCVVIIDTDVSLYLLAQKVLGSPTYLFLSTQRSAEIDEVGE